MALELIHPKIEYERSYSEYIRELMDEERHPFPLDFEYENFPVLLKRLENLSQGIGVPDGFVPSSTFWLVDGSALVGVSNLRHYLNDRLRDHGGHIGLGIRPTSRRRGFGGLLLALTIQEARKKGIADIHVHCHKSNLASARTIVGAGGVLDSETQDRDSAEIIQRYRVAAA